MKPLLKFVCLLLLANFLCPDLFAQHPFKPTLFPGRPYIPRRMILLERKERPVLLKIREKQMIYGNIKRDSSIKLVNARIMRINGDSLYFGSGGYRFHDLESFDLPQFIRYSRSDSLKWKVFFPPENIYHDRESYESYMREITRQFKKVKIPTLSCRSFHNILKLNFTKIVNAEIALDYEHRLSNRWSWEIEAGYQFASNYRMGDDFLLDLFPLYKYSGINIITGPKYSLGWITYLQLVVLYHYLEMDLSKSRVAVSNEKYGLQYQYRNDIGGGLRIGIITRGFGSMLFDSYAGIGLKACLINQFIYGRYYENSSIVAWYNTDHSADNHHVTLLMPVISLGIKFGIGF